MASTLRERNALPVIVQYVLDLNSSRMNAQDLVPAVHDFAFVPNKDIVAVGQKDSLCLSRLVRETIELQRNRRGWRGRRRRGRSGVFNDYRVLGRLNREVLFKDIASTALVKSSFADAQQIR